MKNEAKNSTPARSLSELSSGRSLRVKVGVAYASDVDHATRVLYTAASGLSWRYPIVLLVEFAASSIDFEVSVWTPDVWGLRRGQSELRKELWRALKRNDIAIPFPQVDVHFPDRALQQGRSKVRDGK